MEIKTEIEIAEGLQKYGKHDKRWVSYDDFIEYLENVKLQFSKSTEEIRDRLENINDFLLNKK